MELARLVCLLHSAGHSHDGRARAVERDDKRRLAEIELFDHLIEPNWSAIRDAIRRAENEAELRRVWPLPSRWRQPAAR
jgi:hypothetical protein